MPMCYNFTIKSFGNQLFAKKIAINFYEFMANVNDMPVGYFLIPKSFFHNGLLSAMF